MGAVAWPAWFGAAMKRLVGLKFAPTDLTTHWEALRDLPRLAIEDAVYRAQRECDEFPSPRKLRSFIPMPDMRGHYPPCKTNTECLRKVLAS